MRLASAKMLWTAEARRMSVMNAVSIKRFLFVLKMNIIQILRSVGWAPENILCAPQIFSAPQKYLLRTRKYSQRHRNIFWSSHALRAYKKNQ